MSSINVNQGATIALQMLKDTKDEKDEVQDEVSTGEKVATASDNAALWAVSEIMEGDIVGLEATSQALAIGEAATSVASAGAEQITSVLQDMQQLAIQAQSGTADFSVIEEQLAFKTDQINSIISASQFNGTNLLATDVNGNGASSMTVASSLDRQGSDAPSLSTIEVDSVDFEGSSGFDIDNRTSITDAASAKTALEEINGFLEFAISGAAQLGAKESQISDQGKFVNDLSDAMVKGQSAIKDSQIEDAATRLAALNVQMQLGTSSLSIANSAPASLSALFA